MKKVILFLFVALALSCGGNDDNPSANFTATTVLDGDPFEPVSGVYAESAPDMHRRYIFQMQESGAGNASMSIELFVPFSQQEFTGNYNMGIGEADDALANVYLNKAGTTYNISSDNLLRVTDLGNSRFRFEFIDGYAIVFQGDPVPFSGVIEGRFEPADN